MSTLEFPTWSAVLREPLLHFLTAAGLLFLLNATLAVDQREPILVEAATQAWLFKQQEDLLLRPISPQEKDELVANYIEEEILVREARKRGLDNSSRIRQLLVQNMRFFYLDQNPESPTQAQLRDFFDANPELFATSPGRSFQQLFYSDPALAPPNLSQRLNGAGSPEEFGEGGAFALRQLEASEREIAASFGPDTAALVLAIDDDSWHGPFTSSAGVHYLRLREVLPSRLPEFDAVRQWVQGQWELHRQRKRLDSALSEMRPGYLIEIQAMASGKP